MPDTTLSTIEKALAVNLDEMKYGTIVEIGAGQEVARWFFQAGAAAGTIAKTMSAYDTNFSDAIYGVHYDSRYVSRARCERMLSQEYDLIISRIKDSRPKGSRFFSFANTVAAQGFRKRDECHGWIGVRLQRAPEMEPDNIVLHVRMLDDTNLEQQEALGILGVNLIYGAFMYADDPKRLMRSLLDNLKWGRVEIDLVEFSGPALGYLDNRQMALELVKASLTPAILFGPDGTAQIPADALYKKGALVMRGSFDPLTDVELARFDYAMDRFAAERGIDPDKTVRLAEVTMRELADVSMRELAKTGNVETANYLERIEQLAARGFHILISEFFRYFRVRQYIAHYTQAPVGIVTDVQGFREIIHPEIYDGLDGGILEGIGKLFPDGTTAYVCPTTEGGTRVTLDEIDLDDSLRPLATYLRGLGKLVSADDFEYTAGK